MRSRFLAALPALGGILVPQAAIAVDLVNEDNVAYQVRIVDESGEREVIITPRETLVDICYRCEISIEDVGTISAEPTDTIIIQNGEMSIIS